MSFSSLFLRKRVINVGDIKLRNEGGSGFEWLEGEQYFFSLRLFSLIPIGVHQIYVDRVDENNCEI